MARFLADAGFKVTGVDVSSSMLELARVHVPEANFVKMDMRQLEFDADCFDGICAFYSLFHVPREEHLQVLIGFNRLLRQGGIVKLARLFGVQSKVELVFPAKLEACL